MKNRSGKTVGFAAGAMLVAGLSFWLNLERLTRSAELSETKRANEWAEIAEKIRQTEQRVSLAEHRLSEAEQALAKLESNGTRMAKVAEKAPIMSQSQWMADKPALQVLELERQRAALRQEYGDYFREQGWSSGKIEQFVAIEVNHIERDMDLRDVARSNDTAVKTTVATLQKQAEAEHEAARIELLGREGDRQLREYLDRSVRLQNMLVRGLAGAAALQGAPLTARQGDELERAAVESAPPEARADMKRMLSTIDWAAFEERARRVLSPAQWEIFMTQAPPIGFTSRVGLQLDAAIERALQADAKNDSTPIVPSR